ncbi:unnamed protein product [Toxocara canis]|uniref:SHSP domain-containing protein n=1 Tax=Toxocara canis TaxID=6265 RepID=A0A183UKW9_TOXCA|nr:unnamed protein product [Toxocara canis]
MEARTGTAERRGDDNNRTVRADERIFVDPSTVFADRVRLDIIASKVHLKRGFVEQRDLRDSDGQSRNDRH